MAGSAVLLLCLKGISFAEGIEASCIRDGRAVFRAKLPLNVSEAKRLEIAEIHPDALCVFLRSETSPAVAPRQTAAVRRGGDDLATALSYLDEDAAVGSAYGPGLGGAMENLRSGNGGFVGAEAANTVNLTIGVYEGGSAEDVLTHWEFMVGESPAFSRYAPKIDTLADVAVLTLEDVPDGAADDLCRAAEQWASGCISVY